MQKRSFLTLYILLLVLFLIKFISLILPDVRLWGINQLNFLPASYTIISIILAVIAMTIPWLPRSSNFVNNMADRSARLFYISPQKQLYRLSLIMSIAVLFTIFAAPTHFLGDGYTLLNNLASDTGTFYKWSEKGITLILSGLQSIIGGKSQSSALTAFRIVSIFSGIVSIWFFFKIAAILFEDNFRKMLAFTISIFSAATLLFFGYVENYPLLWTAFGGFIYFSLRYIKTGTGLIWSFLFLSAGLFLHLQMTLLIPVFVYLVFCHDPGKKLFNRFKIPFLIGAVIIVTGFIALLVYKYNTDLYVENIFLPLLGGKPIAPEYALLSFPHLFDIVNQLLLLSPLLVVFIFAGAGNLKNIIRNKSLIFLTLTTLAGWLFLLVIDPKLGMPRDWDLFSPAAFAPSLLFILLAHERYIEAMKRLALSFLILLIVAVIPFLLVNLHAERSLSYIEYLADLDRGKSMSTLVTLREYYGSRGETTRGDSVNNIIPIRFPEVEKMQQAFAAIRNRDIQKAAGIAATIKPDKFSANYHNFMITLYLGLRDYPKALEESKKLIQLQKYNFKYHLNQSYIYMGLRQSDDAINSLRMAYKYNRNSNQVIEMLSNVYFNMARYDSTLIYADKLIGLDSANVAGYYLICKARKMKGDITEARRHFDMYMQKGSIDPLFESRMNELAGMMSGNN